MASLPASEQFNCIRAISSYINKILKPRDAAKQIPGMKCLLLDRETVSLTRTAFPLLAREVAPLDQQPALSSDDIMTPVTEHYLSLCPVRCVLDARQHPRTSLPVRTRSSRYCCCLMRPHVPPPCRRPWCRWCTA